MAPAPSHDSVASDGSEEDHCEVDAARPRKRRRHIEICDDIESDTDEVLDLTSDFDRDNDHDILYDDGKHTDGSRIAGTKDNEENEWSDGEDIDGVSSPNAEIDRQSIIDVDEEESNSEDYSGDDSEDRSDDGGSIPMFRSTDAGVTHKPSVTLSPAKVGRKASTPSSSSPLGNGGDRVRQYEEVEKALKISRRANDEVIRRPGGEMRLVPKGAHALTRTSGQSTEAVSSTPQNEASAGDGRPAARSGLSQKSSLIGMRQPRQEGERTRASLLWPSASRFYRAVLRWMYRVKEDTIDEDGPSVRQKKAESTMVPTEFKSVLEYQRTLSKLVLREALAGLQQALTLGGRSDGASGESPDVVHGQVKSVHLVDAGTSALQDSTDGRLFSFSLKVEPPDDWTPPRRKGSGPADYSPFPGGELVCLQSPTWPASDVATLGVVQTWDPVYDKLAKKSKNNSEAIVRLLVCEHPVGGDGAGGEGGWMSSAACASARRGDTTISMTSIGPLMTSMREFQAVMAVSDLPEQLRECLVCPSVAKFGKASAPRPSGGKSFDALDKGGGVKGQEEKFLVPRPSNVPQALWKQVCTLYNKSQLEAIQHVAEGSAVGITLLQGPPGTGKTRTILGIVGVLLAGGCPSPTAAQATASRNRAGSSKAGQGAKIAIGSSISAKDKKKGRGASIPEPGYNQKIRILVVAPSNAAVDELVVRLCQDGVPSGEGKRHPRVVRVGASRGDEEGERDSLKRAAAPEVQAVSLDKLTTDRKLAVKGSVQVNRLEVLLEADVVCATLSGSGSQPLVEAMYFSANQNLSGKGKKSKKIARLQGALLGFDAVVMDEAAQAVEPSSLIPLRFNARAVVMVGDPAQLPATVFSKEARDANYHQSLFLRLQRGGHPKLMLDTQYRMHPGIASFASGRFYSGMLKSAPSVTETSHYQNFHGVSRFAPYLFHNVSEGRLKRGGVDMSSMSLSNQAEVNYIVSMLKDLVSTFRNTNFNGRVGVIAPYRNQIQALRKAMWYTGLRQNGVEVSTVDGFQGREKDIMVFSCVRAPDEGTPEGLNVNSGVGFVDDWRRLNVAITRAKYAMWIVGHAGVLKQSDEWRELINDSKRRKAYIDYAQDTGKRSSGRDQALRAAQSMGRSLPSFKPPRGAPSADGKFYHNHAGHASGDQSIGRHHHGGVAAVDRQPLPFAQHSRKDHNPQRRPPFDGMPDMQHHHKKPQQQSALPYAPDLPQQHANSSRASYSSVYTGGPPAAAYMPASHHRALVAPAKQTGVQNATGIARYSYGHIFSDLRPTQPRAMPQNPGRGRHQDRRQP